MPQFSTRLPPWLVRTEPRELVLGFTAGLDDKAGEEKAVIFFPLPERIALLEAIARERIKAKMLSAEDEVESARPLLPTC